MVVWRGIALIMGSLVFLLCAATVAGTAAKFDRAMEAFEGDEWEEFEAIKWPRNINDMIKTDSKNPKQHYFVQRIQTPSKEGKHTFTFKTRGRATAIHYRLKTLDPVEVQPAIDGKVNSFFGPIDIEGYEIVSAGEHEFTIFASNLKFVRRWYKDVGKNYFLDDVPTLALAMSLSTDAGDIELVQDVLNEKADRESTTQTINQPLG